ncbi:hypothetical protein [Notoacmeibacter ruber]|uniref:Uncharacterized protein n=1 Tax=Notoacmeibacter ruber TaxID=2670375 RepID=A0A3L7J458_9HYPH|nr:hypothetical protein [Notoacmeibacter ruber]RLQ85239.1 hypothetical protein D8780_14855 [Notoacmeibacter ruber]
MYKTETNGRPIKRTPGPVELPLAAYECIQPFSNSDLQHSPNIDAVDAASAELEWMAPTPGPAERLFGDGGKRNIRTS